MSREPMKLKQRMAVIAAALVAGAAFAQSPPDPKKTAEGKPPAKSEAKAAKKPPPKKVEKKPGENDAKKAAAKPAQQPAKQIRGNEQKLGPGTYSTGPAVLRDKDGNVIPTSPDAYNVDSAIKKK